jgi:hypothetical protein
VGGDGFYFLTPQIGVGGIIRYSHVGVTFQNTLAAGLPGIDTKAGGLTIDGGVRVVF